MNPLNDNPNLRRIAYYVQFVVAGLILLLGMGFAAADAGLPTWYVVTAAVTSGLWSYLGLTAAQNVPSYRDVVEGDAPAPPVRDERGEVSVVGVLLVVLLVVVVLVLVGAIR